MRSETKQSRDFYLLGLHEFNLALLSFLKSLLGIGALGLEGLLQLSHSLHCLVAVNCEQSK